MNKLFTVLVVIATAIGIWGAIYSVEKFEETRINYETSIEEESNLRCIELELTDAYMTSVMNDGEYTRALTTNLQNIRRECSNEFTAELVNIYAGCYITTEEMELYGDQLDTLIGYIED